LTHNINHALLETGSYASRNHDIRRFAAFSHHRRHGGFADMSTVRVALANVRVPASPPESVILATSAVAEAGRQGALVVCFPECFVPGYRWPGSMAPRPDPAFLTRAWAEVAEAARTASITVILGTERVTDGGLQITVCVIDPDGTVAGWQDKGQIDPSE